MKVSLNRFVLKETLNGLMNSVYKSDNHSVFSAEKSNVEQTVIKLGKVN